MSGPPGLDKLLAEYGLVRESDLAARLAEAERELDELRHDIERHIAAASSEAARTEAAEASLARMREALECIACRTQTMGLLWWQIEARAALEGE